MKKFAVVAIALVLGTSIAVASSIAIPWFVDNAPRFNGVPGAASGVTGLINLKNNVDEELVCYITYYSSEGVRLGPEAPNNSFAIAPLSALAFRPVEKDPDASCDAAWVAANGLDPAVYQGQNGGQEGRQGVLVPVRPRNVDTKRNGSCVIEWFGHGPDAVQGNFTYFQTTVNQDGSKVTMSYGHLLPPGVSN